MHKTRFSALDLFRRLAGSALPDGSVLEAAACERWLRPGEPLFHAAEKMPFVFVVNEGIVKMTYETPNGDSWVKGFAEAGACFASLKALEREGLTSFSAYAVVESCIHQIDYQVLLGLAEKHIAWQRAMANALKLYGQRKEQREMELLTLSPEDRYLRFMHDHPELVVVLRQRDIASYIRVTPVALSRIKSRLGKKSARHDAPPDGPQAALAAGSLES